MERIDNALFSMEVLGTMQSILRETGAYHRRIAGFSQEMFKVRSQRKGSFGKKVSISFQRRLF